MSKQRTCIGWFLFLGGLSFVLSCSQGTQEAEAGTQAFVFHDRLSDYQFFQGALAELTPQDHVYPYDLNTPLFSDYALKARFISLPAGQKMTYKQGEIDFPDGAVLIKNFYYHEDHRDLRTPRRLIETRLLRKQEGEWKVANYLWNEAQTDAERNILGHKTDVSWIDTKGVAQQIRYVVPDNNDCKSCHKRNENIAPIGPSVRNLNVDRTLSGQLAENQLQHWQEMGIMEGLPTDQALAKLARWDDSHASLNDKARAYLEVNCAHCHSATGPAMNTALFLNVEETDPHRLGIFKGPVSAAQGSGNLKYNIVPGKAEESILAYRVNSVETGVAMPEIGKTIVHQEGVELITAWINEMAE